MMIFNPPLNSPEYKAQLARLLADRPSQPRQDWPVDTRGIVQRHKEIAAMALGWAVENMKKAAEVEDLE